MHSTHDVEGLCNIARVIRGISVPYPTIVGFGMDRTLQQGEPSTHLVEERIDTMQARFVVEPSRLAFFVVVAEIGEVGHG